MRVRFASLERQSRFEKIGGYFCCGPAGKQKMNKTCYAICVYIYIDLGRRKSIDAYAVQTLSPTTPIPTTTTASSV